MVNEKLGSRGGGRAAPLSPLALAPRAARLPRSGPDFSWGVNALTLPTSPCEWTYALSIKQPWATLILHGVKTIEIRRWATAYRGRLLIHAARVPDVRNEGWRLVTSAMGEMVEMSGGIIGAVNLVECRNYRDRSLFLADAERHRNEADWYRPELVGFVLEHPERLSFRPFKGNVRLFRVPAEGSQLPPRPRGSRPALRGG